MLVKRDYKTLLPKLLDALFDRPDDRHRAVEILTGYVSESPERVQVGVLRLSNRDFGRMQSLIDLAKCDYRDLLIQAEYPLSFRADSKSEEYRVLQEREAKEYDEWIAKTLT